MLIYARNFENAAKEALKRTTHWVVYYFYKFKVFVSCTRTCHDPVGHTGIQIISPVPIAPQNMQNMKDWVQTFWCCGASGGKSWNSPVVPRLERNSARSTAQLRTVWPRGAAKKKKKDRRRGKWDIRVRFPSSDEESNKPFLDDETRCDDGHSIFGTRDSLSPRKIFPALEEVFASTAKLCSVDFS